MRLEALIGTDADGRRETLAIGNTAEVGAAYKAAVRAGGVVGRKSFVALDWLTPRSTRRFHPAADDGRKAKKDKSLLEP